MFDLSWYGTCEQLFQERQSILGRFLLLGWDYLKYRALSLVIDMLHKLQSRIQ